MLARLAPTLIVIGVFCLGFLDEPENSAWLNRSYLWGPGDPFFSESEERFVASPLLVWKGRPNYAGRAAYPFAGVRNAFRHNSMGLRDDEVGSRPDAVVRIVNLGDSSTWGLNLRSRDDTYSDQLQTLLDLRSPGGFDVVNAGTIGYSSFQGVQFLRTEIAPLEPDVVTVYLGNNDPAAARLPDHERVDSRLIGLRSLLGRNLFYLLLRKAWLSLRYSGAEDGWSELEGIIRDRQRSPAFRSKRAFYASLARVAPDEHEANLRAMVEASRAVGARLVLLEVPMNLVWPAAVHPTIDRFAVRSRQFWSPAHIERGYLGRAQRGRTPSRNPLPGHPYLSLLSSEVLEERLQNLGSDDFAATARARLLEPGMAPVDRLRLAHNLAIWDLAHDDVAGAAVRLADLARDALRCTECPLPSDVSQILYSAGIAALLDGRDDAAFELLSKSREVWPFAMSPDYALRLRRVADDLNVTRIDLPEEFVREDPRFRGSALIHDWVHPNARGNAVVARALADALAPEAP